MIEIFSLDPILSLVCYIFDTCKCDTEQTYRKTIDNISNMIDKIENGDFIAYKSPDNILDITGGYSLHIKTAENAFDFTRTHMVGISDKDHSYCKIGSLLRLPKFDKITQESSFCLYFIGTASEYMSMIYYVLHDTVLLPSDIYEISDCLYRREYSRIINIIENKYT